MYRYAFYNFYLSCNSYDINLVVLSKFTRKFVDFSSTDSVLCLLQKIVFFSFTNNDGTEANASACSVYENSISLFGMSKSFAMPGLRLGWLCTRNKQIFDMMSNFKDYITICPPSPSEILSLIGKIDK